ncbi:hypothetical protein CCUS01_14801 [Colletotrichum cuscutae]|uniref:Uncharacterized protein n=1 Tax=Colletotrichum cuscutae TaxID=1209917 RepID=A0AAI9Y5F3_9PEZI|nr:hypothetical protein CCUS01_14801 [Colletotrichum cuscutae]
MFVKWVVWAPATACIGSVFSMGRNTGEFWPLPIPHPTQICVPDEHATTGASGCHAPPPRFFFFVRKPQAKFRLVSPVVTCEGSIDCI